jgi:acyl dehydratase
MTSSSTPIPRAAETPFGGTIAHGFLVLSLLSAMTYETLPSIEKSKMAINQGFDKLRFPGAGEIGRASAPALCWRTST